MNWGGVVGWIIATPFILIVGWLLFFLIWASQ